MARAGKFESTLLPNNALQAVGVYQANIELEVDNELDVDIRNSRGKPYDVQSLAREQLKVEVLFHKIVTRCKARRIKLSRKAVPRRKRSGNNLH
mmetsp:Transcript_1291/g.2417  ORF Transcript_1291/g.2417 Transcript_1291/m.2417 type:complete len:94 (-) Transcript_1291:134-415(-)